MLSASLQTLDCGALTRAFCFDSACGVRTESQLLSVCGCGQAALHKRTILAAILAAAAVLFRQTNAVWAAFILVVSPARSPTDD